MIACFCSTYHCLFLHPTESTSSLGFSCSPLGLQRRLSRSLGLLWSWGSPVQQRRLLRSHAPCGIAIAHGLPQEEGQSLDQYNREICRICCTRRREHALSPTGSGSSGAAATVVGEKCRQTELFNLLPPQPPAANCIFTQQQCPAAP